MSPNSKVSYQTAEMKTVCNFQQIHTRMQTYKQTDRWNRMESPGVDPHIVNWYLTKEQKAIQWKKYHLFNKCIWNNGISICKKKMKLATDFTPFIRISSIWIIDLRVKWKAIKLLEDNIGRNLDDPGQCDAFLDTTSETTYERNNL